MTAVISLLVVLSAITAINVLTEGGVQTRRTPVASMVVCSVCIICLTVIVLSH
ncbi:hypothetical protein D3C81_182480 [compost metagenome]